MAITTLAGANTGLTYPKKFVKQSGATLTSSTYVWYSTWFASGAPISGVADLTTSGGVARSSTSAQVTGQITFTDPVSGNSYLAGARAAIGNSSTVVSTPQMMLCDRLWECGLNDTTTAAFSPTIVTPTAQTITTMATLPARDLNGANNGDGVYIALEVQTNMGSGVPVFTLSYTNSAGTAGRTASTVQTYANFTTKGGFYPFALQAGDVGVRSVQSITASASQTLGQWVLVAFRPLLIVDAANNAPMTTVVDPLTGGFQRMYNGSVPFWLYRSNSGTPGLSGAVNVSQG